MVRDVCVFSRNNARVIGKVLQLVKYDIRGKKSNYRGTYATVAGRFGALCAWYDISETRICHMSLTESEYIPIEAL